ncbi:hypothetical protein [Tsukamurella tyrosinosolvens]|uniref:hypothetical protein n=1 Tax=Tsukamurella tyrosinosolvens TaxID=57704 RepID=UPI002DD42FCE|nr:hypothetical protein [Tsukamurella tyrosinosolvens]MEC4614942.1 hypothetical protein [Tsukamurella tyrosinosolvens]
MNNAAMCITASADDDRLAERVQGEARLHVGVDNVSDELAEAGVFDRPQIELASSVKLRFDQVLVRWRTGHLPFRPRFFPRLDHPPLAQQIRHAVCSLIG